MSEAAGGGFMVQGLGGETVDRPRGCGRYVGDGGWEERWIAEVRMDPGCNDVS